MKTNIHFNRLFTVALSSALFATACGMEAPDYGAYPPADEQVTTKMTKEEATAIAEVALAGVNTDDYGMWTTRWDPSLLDGIPESTWRELNAGLIAQAGKFQSILETRVNEALTPGYIRFSFLAQFEKAQVVLIHIYPEDGALITGVHLRDANAPDER